METSKRSYRPAEIAERNSVSVAFIYEQIKLGRLRARKAATATLITVEDESAWLDAMPFMSASDAA
jgi:predicted site-specific integrase-resolvase